MYPLLSSVNVVINKPDILDSWWLLYTEFYTESAKRLTICDANFRQFGRHVGGFDWNHSPYRNYSDASRKYLIHVSTTLRTPLWMQPSPLDFERRAPISQKTSTIFVIVARWWHESALKLNFSCTLANYEYLMGPITILLKGQFKIWPFSLITKLKWQKQFQDGLASVFQSYVAVALGSPKYVL